MSLWSDGGATFAGDVTFGGSLFIGGTGSANELDDYEEGTFTMTVTGQSNGTGNYTKIGRVVHVWCLFQCDTNHAGSDPVQVGGLPFAAKIRTALNLEIYNANAVGGQHVATMADGQQVWVDTSVDASAGYIRATSVSGNNPYYLETIFADDSVLFFNGTYYAT